MTIAIPIVTSFDNKGISSAVKEFKNLETNGEKANFAIQKAALPAAAALAGLTVALGSAAKAAIEDAAAQDKLAEQIRRTTGATDEQIVANEDWISTQGKLLGVTDDELRPALGGLIRATGDITKAQQLAAAAMDISAAKGVSLETVTKTLEKAYGGNFTALAKLSPELRQMIKDGASLDEVMAAMSKTFGGAASEAAETTAGKFARMKLALDETKESIGAALMPAIEAILPVLQSFATWAQDNPEKFLAIAAAVAAISAAVVIFTVAAKAATVVNALLATSFTALQVATGLIVFTAIIAGLVLAYNKFEWFRNGVKAVMSGIAEYFEFIANAWIKVINVIIKGINLIKPGKDLGTLSSISIGGAPGGAFTSTAQAEASLGFTGTAEVAALVPYNIDQPTTPGKIQKSEPPVFDKTSGNAGGFEQAGIGGIGPFDNLTINLDAGLISSPATIGQDIIDAILAAQRDSGVVFAPAVTF
jgi:hypothetical protein